MARMLREELRYFDHPLPPVIRVIRASPRSSVPFEFLGNVNEA